MGKQKFSAAVGDITIVANRSEYVDFTLPYTESGVSMIVAVQEYRGGNMWIFLKPLTAGLWLSSIAFFCFTGFVVWAIEHRGNPEFRGTPSQQLGITFYFAFSTLVYAHSTFDPPHSRSFLYARHQKVLTSVNMQNYTTISMKLY